MVHFGLEIESSDLGMKAASLFYIFNIYYIKARLDYYFQLNLGVVSESGV